MSITTQLIEDYRAINRSETELVRRGPNCLLVEDDPTDAALSKYALDALGVPVQMADSGDQAIRLLEASKDPNRPDFDIVFLDLVLRGSAAQGVQVLEYIRSHFPSVHVVLVSGFIDQGVLNLITHHKGKGAYLGVVSKPLQKSEITEILQKHRLPVPPYEI